MRPHAPTHKRRSDEREQHGCHARDSQRARARTRTAEGVAEGVRAIAIAMSNSVRESHRRETRATEDVQSRVGRARPARVLFSFAR